ncbi:hypothetical protein OSB04_003555 [Centaurea solstitialis]|uniref:Reverse transcriptase domain-containing protein n=1 Tax=Centaurea solstitialis TaxID=347529 RepID=A0AA38WV97_9ASTR|nr:hypothetical protein OSB04_003555 [Centaurea solstitialis]
MNGPFPGQILTPVGIVGNNGTYTLTYAIVEVETKSSWTWFMDDLNMVTNSNFTFISDKQKGIIPAITKVFPCVEHRYCVRHIEENMKCATATTIQQFDNEMNNLKKINATCYDWLKKIPHSTSPGLTDLKLGGRKYTWMKSDLSKSSKLDRFLVNSVLVDQWPPVSSFALPRLLSDHCPILMESGSPDFGPVPFKWFNSWLSIKDLDGVIRRKWEEDLPEFHAFSKIERLSRKLRHIKKAVKEWRAKVKFDSCAELQEIIRKVSAIDLLAENGCASDTMVKERTELLVKASDIYATKLSDLKQKAKFKWTLEGDDNTRFFHGLVNQKHKRARIHGININGCWTSCPDKIKEAAFSFFKSKFEEPHPSRPAFNSSLFKKLSSIQTSQLETPFGDQEVKKVVWSCGHNKAPGPDGFTFEFIRKYWEVVGGDFIEAVKFFESNMLINPGSNSSFITLVPKVRDPLSLADFRPINLNGCISKVVSKVLAERLKDVLDSVISSSQSAFIKGRNILDGPLMVNEIISWSKKKRKQTLIFKADFAKAFDTLNWNFLDNVLLQMGFGIRWRACVKGLISTAKSSVLINGVPTKEFRVEKGVRQGDPLAPFLFILAAEGLNVAFKEAQRANIFKGIRLDDSIEELSILQFADDAIIMGEWDPLNAKNLIRILKCFELCSGLSINLSKSSLLGISVPNEEVQRVALGLNCKVGSVPFTYLGIPVGENMSKASAWQPIIDKFKSRLSSWKAKHLSVGGRLCLIKSVLGGLGNYFFSIYKAPNKVLNTLETIRRKFFWGELEQSKKINWISWNKVLRYKQSGGLGIGSLKALNLALLSKWHWREKIEPNALWNRVISAASCSNIGAGTSVWKKIKNIDRELSEWGINLSNLFVHKADGRGWSWKMEDNGLFTVSSLRKLIDCIILPTADSETIWVKWVTGKANIHLWRVLNNRLATMDNLTKRGNLGQPGFESSDHIFGDCSTAKIVSAHLSSWVNWWPTDTHSVSQLWGIIDSNSANRLERNIRRTIGAAFFWEMWNNRNRKAFNGTIKSEKVISEDIKYTAYDWVRCRTKFGKGISWENWCCNPFSVIPSCTSLAPR